MQRLSWIISMDPTSSKVSLKEGGAGRLEGRRGNTDCFEDRGSGRGSVAFSSVPQQKANSLQSLWKPTTHRSILDSDLQNHKRLGLCGVQIRSVAQACPTLCDPMNRSTPGLPVHHQLLEFTQTHVHRVSDVIQPSHPLATPSPLAPNPSQHQSLFQ